MGDFVIPGAPFVLSLPDDWVVGALSESLANCIVAVSPQEDTEVFYHLFPASSIGEVIDDPQLMLPLFYSMMQFELNGMDCVMYNGLIPTDIMGYALSQVDPMAATMRASLGALMDITIVNVEHQGVVLRIAITKERISDEFDGAEYPPALLVMSGVAPGSPFLVPGEDPFSPLTVSPLEVMKQRTNLPTKSVPHKGIQRKKLKHKKSALQGIHSLLIEKKPLVWCLNKLEEISKALQRNREYGQYSQDLDRIHAMLKEQWGFTDATEHAVPSETIKTPSPAHAPRSSAEKAQPTKSKETAASCIKCKSPLQSTDKFCRNCGASRAPRAKRWTPQSKT